MERTVLIVNANSREQLNDIHDHFLWIQQEFGNRVIEETSCVTMLFTRVLTKEEMLDIDKNARAFEVDDLFLIVDSDIAKIDGLEVFRVTNYE